jgi:Skp family chaperone for outer membrane proteins
MKTTKLFMAIMCLAIVSSLSAQTTKPAEKTNKYFVQVSHTPDQCLNTLTEMKDKGDAYLAKFNFGCMSGDHTAYAFLDGKSEEDIRQMLPKDQQTNAKIVKVDKFTAAQIEKMHKEHAAKN